MDVCNSRQFAQYVYTPDGDVAEMLVYNAATGPAGASQTPRF